MDKTVYITKYALTSGVIVAQMDVKDDGKSCYGRPPEWYASTGFFGKDFHLTKEEAEKDCEDRRLKKIHTLKKQIAKFEKMTFEIKEHEEQ